MKRGGPLKRTTELKRTGFKRNPDKPPKPMKRTRLKPMSDTRRDELPERRRVHDQVLARDGHKCLLRFAFPDQPCGGELHPHHLLKASQGGKYEPDNLLTACNVHNDMVETEPDIAAAMGLVRRPVPKVLEPDPMDAVNPCGTCGDETMELIPGLLIHGPSAELHAHKAVPAVVVANDG